MQQLTLLQDEKKEFKAEEIVEEENENTRLITEFPLSYCKNEIMSSIDLWDMRCWDKHKDREEVLNSLKNYDSLNCGHTSLCIHIARDLLKVDIEEIANWIMQNSNIQFKNRLVKCGNNPELCPKYQKQGDYGNDICKNCHSEVEK